MRSILSKPEAVLLAVCLTLLAAALLVPAMNQPAHYHDFADQRALWGLPFAMDVLSNLPFALAGLAGALRLYLLPVRRLSNMQRKMAALFFGGLLLTAVASSWYHWQPDDAGLAVDRCGMAVAFAGLLGLAAAGRVSERAGAALGVGVLLLATLAIRVWSSTGNVVPWAVLQVGGMGLVVWFALLRARHATLDIRWGLVIAAYAAAKLCELNDDGLYQLTAHLVSGHTLKHLLAAFAAWPVIAAVGALRDSRQNAAGITGTKDAARRVGHARPSQKRSPV